MPRIKITGISVQNHINTALVFISRASVSSSNFVWGLLYWTLFLDQGSLLLQECVFGFILFCESQCECFSHACMNLGTVWPYLRLDVWIYLVIQTTVISQNFAFVRVLPDLYWHDSSRQKAWCMWLLYFTRDMQNDFNARSSELSTITSDPKFVTTIMSSKMSSGNLHCGPASISVGRELGHGSFGRVFTGEFWTYIQNTYHICTLKCQWVNRPPRRLVSW